MSADKKTILIVDDDIDLLTQNEIKLKNAGFNVIACTGQDEAEMVFKKTRPDMVITDLMMEALDGGFALSQYIKKKDPTIPVIVVTGVLNETGMKFSNSNEIGIPKVKADAVLSKPMKFEDLLEEINKYI